MCGVFIILGIYAIISVWPQLVVSQFSAIRLDTYVEFLIFAHQVPYVAEQSHAYGTSPSETVNP